MPPGEAAPSGGGPLIQESERAFASGVALRDGATAHVRARLHEPDPHVGRLAFAALPPEFAALERAGLPPGPLYAAAAEAERVGASPFDTIATSGVIDEDVLVEALARGLGVDVASAAGLDCPAIDAETFEQAMRSGYLWSPGRDGSSRLVVAARGDAVGRLAANRRGKSQDARIALAAPRAFADIAVRRAGSAVAERAAEGPARICPELTVAGGLPKIRPVARTLIVGAIVATGAIALAVDAVGTAVLAVVGLVFAVLNLFRLALVVAPLNDSAPVRLMNDADLPVYTVLAAVFREGAVIGELLDALDRLDYPRAKLDIKILTEAGDHETHLALSARPPRSGIEVLVLPPGGPKTKPRALNAGLISARGALLTVFDAEDRPEPQQLRIAAEAFRRGKRSLACVQARLAIDNIRDGWLSRQFAIEYAALFDVVLPALSRFGLPIPLGGTSNHFRVDALKAVGGWDAGNVTEDADLGLRLARLGWTTGTIASATWEEAPTTFPVWFKQRTRWMKGFMMTALVHGRHPLTLARRLNPIVFLASQLLIGGVALTALAYPVVTVFVLWRGLDGTLLAPADGLLDALMTGLHVVNLIVGFTAGLASAWIGIDRRCPQSLAAHLVLLPVYWFIVGCAAWRALWQIATARASHWEKTPHGVSRRRATPDYT